MSHDATRRAVMAALASLPLAGSSQDRTRSAVQSGVRSTVLVAYFSRSGNTRVVAGLLQRAFKADLFEITPQAPYPEEYLATVERARQEQSRGHTPALQATVGNMATHETLYLGFPIWGTTAPPVVKSFLRAHDLAGKRLVPFVTHGGYGLGDSQSVLASLAPTARLEHPFSMQADQERKTMERVHGWLNQ